MITAMMPRATKIADNTAPEILKRGVVGGDGAADFAGVADRAAIKGGRSRPQCLHTVAARLVFSAQNGQRRTSPDNRRAIIQPIGPSRTERTIEPATESFALPIA